MSAFGGENFPENEAMKPFYALGVNIAREVRFLVETGIHNRTKR
jgi:hypothetical protein